MIAATGVLVTSNKLLRGNARLASIAGGKSLCTDKMSTVFGYNKHSVHPERGKSSSVVTVCSIAMGDSMVERLSIEFDRENKTYMPGEFVSGRILAEFSQQTQVRGLEVTVKGKSMVQWFSKSDKTRRDAKNRSTHCQMTIDSHNLVMTGHEEYFSSRFYLLGSQSGPHIMLSSGQHAYPFEFQLPINLPCSFDHKLGYIRYTIEAIFDGKMNHEVMNDFTVVSTYDLNRISKAYMPIKENLTKNCCCSCICLTGKIHARLSVPSTGFVPGQVIPVTVDCENESTVDVEKIKVSLRRELKFYAKSPYWTTKVEESVVAETKCVAPFTKSFEDRVTMKLEVPPLPPTGLEHCGLIDVDYVLRIVMCFSGMHFSVERRFPILIGTVPLRSSVNAYGPNEVTAPHRTQGSAPSAVIPFSKNWDLRNSAPPTYEAAVHGVRTISHENDTSQIYGAGNSFALRYPVCNNSPAYTVLSVEYCW